MDFFKKHEKTIIWAVVLVIIPVFGIGGLLTSRAVFTHGKTIGTLGDEKVTMEDLRKFAAKHSFPTNVALDTFAQQYMPFYAEFEKAKHSGFMVSEAEIKDTIKNSPMFQDDGKFSAKRLDSFLEHKGMNQKVLFDAVREQILLSKTNPGMLYMLRNVIPVFVNPTSYTSILQQPVPVTNDEITLKYQQENDTFKIKYIRIPVVDLEKDQMPTYEEIKDIYNQARAHIDSEAAGMDASGFFTTHPIRDDIVKEWIVVRYLGISKLELSKMIDVDEAIVVDYYEKNKDAKYKIPEKKDDEKAGDKDGEAEDKDKDPKKKEDDKPAEPKYKPLDDTLKKSIENVLREREVDRIAAFLKDRIEDIRNEALNRGETVTYKEIANMPFLNDFEPSTGYALTPDKKAVITGLSDPVEIPKNRYSQIWIDVREEKKAQSRFGSLSMGYTRERTDWQRAYDALTQPDRDISTDFLKMSRGYLMFTPVWWPNMETQSGNKADLTYIVPFPDKKTVGVKDDSEEGKKKKEEKKDQSLLDLKIELTKETAGITLYSKIKKQLINKKKEAIARAKAEDLDRNLTPENFEELAKTHKYEVETDGPKNLAQGGDAFEACYFLKPEKEKSAVFSASDRKGRYYGIGMLIQRNPADTKSIPQEKINTIKEQIRREKEREFANLVNEIQDLDWKPKD